MDKATTALITIIQEREKVAVEAISTSNYILNTAKEIIINHLVDGRHLVNVSTQKNESALKLLNQIGRAGQEKEEHHE